MLDLNQLIEQLLKVRKLPTLSSVALLLESSLNEEQPDVQRISSIISDDPPVTSMILKLANSVVFGARRTIGTVQEAVVRLGFQEIRKMVMSLALIQFLSNRVSGKVDPVKFWQHSISVGVCTEVINELTGVIPENGPQAHVVGLLHDIGRWVSATYMPEVHQHIPGDADNPPRPNYILTLERNRIGLDHTQIGAALLERWGLPLKIVHCVRFHHEPDVSPRQQRKITQLVHLADSICNNARIGDVGEGLGSEIRETTWSGLGLTADLLPEILEVLIDRTKHSDVLLSIGGMDGNGGGHA
ncbi:HDOD domain-containing protein [bacterium]|nr:HDOD domain-containing protein [bacterium]